MMTVPTLNPDNFPAPVISKELVENALTALLKFSQKQKEVSSKSDLLSDEAENISLNFGLAKVLVPNGGKGTNGKPINISLPHPMHKVLSEDTDSNLENVDICLIVKGDSKEKIQDLIDRFPSHLSCIKKVLTLDSLRKKYPEFKHRRELYQRFDLFLVDDRILPMVGKALGKIFFKSGNKMGSPPIPISVTNPNKLPFLVSQVLSSSFFTIPAGTCVGVRIGRTSMELQKLVENVIKATEQVAQKLPGEWGNILSVSVKTPSSVSLPFHKTSYEEWYELSCLAGLECKNRTVDEEKVSEETTSKKRKNQTESPLLAALKQQKAKSSDNSNVSALKTKTPKKRKSSNADETSLSEIPTNDTIKDVAKETILVQKLATSNKSSIDIKNSSKKEVKKRKNSVDGSSEPKSSVQSTHAKAKKDLVEDKELEPKLTSAKKSKVIQSDPTPNNSSTPQSSNKKGIAAEEITPTKEEPKSSKKNQKKRKNSVDVASETKSADPQSNKKKGKSADEIKESVHNTKEESKSLNKKEKNKRKSSVDIPSTPKNAESEREASQVIETKREAIKIQNADKPKTPIKDDKSTSAEKSPREKVDKTESNSVESIEKKPKYTKKEKQILKNLIVDDSKRPKEQTSDILDVTVLTSAKKNIIKTESKKDVNKQKTSNTGAGTPIKADAVTDKNEQKSAKKDKEKKQVPNDKADTTPMRESKIEKTKDAFALFIPQKTFSGSKEGYVFHSGKQGVGYYLDKPPKVDLKALVSSLKKKGGQGRSSTPNNRNKKQGGGRRRSF